MRLSTHDHNESDYINASYIRLRGSPRQYIATQGPLAVAFGDFWQLVVQERVRVVVMLTHLVEGGREKCGNYFVDGRYGPITVQTERSSHADQPPASAGGGGAGGFFSAMDCQRSGSGGLSPLPATSGGASSAVQTGSSTRRRILLVRHDDDAPNAAPRRVLHVQYLAWPDFDIPPDATDVLSLVREVNAAQEASLAETGVEAGPVLAHCSAGVGRTGSMSSCPSVYCF